MLWLYFGCLHRFGASDGVSVLILDGYLIEFVAVCIVDCLVFDFNANGFVGSSAFIASW